MAILKKFQAPLMGAVAGAIATAVAGFTVGGWMTADKAESLASAQSTAAVVSVLAPICAQNFNSDADRTGQLAELQGKSSYKQVAIIEKGGWAEMPGSTSVSRGVARGCADLIVAKQ